MDLGKFIPQPISAVIIIICFCCQPIPPGSVGKLAVVGQNSEGCYANPLAQNRHTNLSILGFLSPGAPAAHQRAL